MEKSSEISPLFHSSLPLDNMGTLMVMIDEKFECSALMEAWSFLCSLHLYISAQVYMYHLTQLYE